MEIQHLCGLELNGFPHHTATDVLHHHEKFTNIHSILVAVVHYSGCGMNFDHLKVFPLCYIAAINVMDSLGKVFVQVIEVLKYCIHLSSVATCRPSALLHCRDGISHLMSNIPLRIKTKHWDYGLIRPTHFLKSESGNLPVVYWQTWCCLSWVLHWGEASGGPISASWWKAAVMLLFVELCSSSLLHLWSSARVIFGSFITSLTAALPRLDQIDALCLVCLSAPALSSSWMSLALTSHCELWGLILTH